MDLIQPSDDERRIAAMCRALSHPLRVGIVRFVAAHPGSICNQIVLRTNRAQSTISEHLRILVAAGLLECEHEGQVSAYWLAPEALELLRNALADISLRRRT